MWEGLCAEWLDPVTGIIWEMPWEDLPRHVALRARACTGPAPAYRERWLCSATILLESRLDELREMRHAADEEIAVLEGILEERRALLSRAQGD